MNKDLGRLAQDRARGSRLESGMSNFTMPERTPAATARAAKVADLRKQGITVPSWIVRHLDSDVPPTAVQDGWLAWSRIWPRPTRSTWPDTALRIELVQENWDESDRHVKAIDEMRADQAKEKADKQRARDEETETRRVAALDQVKVALRSQFMALPGASEAEFEAEYPQLLSEHRRREMGRAEAESKAAMRSAIKEAF